MATERSPNNSPQPTDTPTPLPTDKPTKTPKPTATPTPVKSKQTTSSSPTSTNTQNILADEISGIATDNDTASIAISTDEAYPTSILGASSKSAERKVTNSPPKKVLVKGISSSLPQLFAVIVGGLLFVVCGVLLYLKKKRIWKMKKYV